MLSILLPATCPVCGSPAGAPCPSCWRLLEPAPPLPPPPGVDSCRSLLLYAGAGRELVARLKYRNARGAVAWLAGAMAGLVSCRAGELDAVTWAPTSRERRRQRGFDQAELLARAVARRIAVPPRALLVRLPGPPQTGRDRAERALGPAFAATRPSAVPPNVLVVDDVLTTGATIAAAAGALRAAGATSVVAITAARTPLKISGGAADPKA